jgi:Holliday junction resolvasome RuvABC endonuclease subunit
LVQSVGTAPPSRILAFDLSTTCIGWALGIDGGLTKHGKLIFKASASVGEKLAAWEEFASSLIEAVKPDQVALERPMSRRGNVTARHYELVGILRYVYRKAVGAEIGADCLIPAETAKLAVGVRKGGTYKDRKRYMVERINAITGLALKYHPNSKLQSDDDIADAIAILLTHTARANDR